MGTISVEGDLPDGRTLKQEHVGPTAVRMLLGAQLRRLRELRGISREDAATAVGAPIAKFSRLERGRTEFKQRDVADLLTLYGVTDEAEFHGVLGLARQANLPGWWQHYDDLVPHWFEPYLGLELAASVIRSYELQFIPGLLQTEEYARAVICLSHYDDADERIQRRVNLRMHRQHILARPDPPRLWVVIDESALRRPVGGRAIQRAQLTRLIEITQLPHVTVQVMPFQAGGHVAVGGPITILRFPEGDLSDVVYLEQLTSALYLDEQSDVTHYRDVMNRLSMQAIPPAASRVLLGRIRAEI